MSQPVLALIVLLWKESRADTTGEPSCTEELVQEPLASLSQSQLPYSVYYSSSLYSLPREWEVTVSSGITPTLTEPFRLRLMYSRLTPFSEWLNTMLSFSQNHDSHVTFSFPFILQNNLALGSFERIEKHKYLMLLSNFSHLSFWAPH